LRWEYLLDRHRKGLHGNRRTHGRDVNNNRIQMLCLQLRRAAFEQTTQKELTLFLKVPRQESLLWS
jgi:hypothetical protein